MLKKIKTHIYNIWLSGAALLIYVLIVGPLLLSEADTPTVIAGIAIGIATLTWFIQTIKHKTNNKE